MKDMKKRYILVYFDFDQINYKDLIREIKTRIMDLFGAIGLKSINVKMINMNANFFVLRCNLDSVDDLLFTLSSMKYKNSPLLPLRTSGTIKKLKSFLSNFNLD